MKKLIALIILASCTVFTAFASTSAYVGISLPYVFSYPKEQLSDGVTAGIQAGVHFSGREEKLGLGAGVRVDSPSFTTTRGSERTPLGIIVGFDAIYCPVNYISFGLLAGLNTSIGENYMALGPGAVAKVTLYPSLRSLFAIDIGLVYRSLFDVSLSYLGSSFAPFAGLVVSR